MLTLLCLASAIALSMTQELGAPEVVSTDITPLQIQSVEHDGANVLAITCNELVVDSSKYNVYYGVDEESLKKCTDVTVDQSVLSCNDLVVSTGHQVLVVERLDANNEVEARHRFQWHFKAPVVESLTGGEDGTPLIVGGNYFGPVDSLEPSADIASHLVEVFVGPFAVHSASAPCHVTSTTTISCAGGLPVGFGTGLVVRVCVDGVCGTSDGALHDFAQPEVRASYVVDGRLHLVGKGFGPHIENVEGDPSLAPLVVEIDGRPCANPKIVVADTEISCDASEQLQQESVVLQRHELRSTVKRQNVPPPVITDVFPTVGNTDGNFQFIVEGTDFGLVGQTVIVRVNGRPAIGCTVTTNQVKITCTRAPQGVGTALDVTVQANAAAGGGIGNGVGLFSYTAPAVTSASRANTKGGKIFVFGSNFGPSFVATRVFVFSGTEREECTVEKKSHTKIQCDAPHGQGDHYNIQVEVGGQTSQPNRSFGYKRPDIHATTRPHWAGGHLYIRGRNFGRQSRKISVYIDDEECKYVKLTKAHEEIRCRAPPGEVDGMTHTVKVRVDGQSSSKDGHAFHHMQYGNNAPVFDGHTDHFTAVACDPLTIKLHAHDEDGDEIYFRGRGLPEGASWKNGFDYMQISYSVPHGLLSYPRTEMNVTVEAGVTDGPGHTSALIHVNARACPATMDACKDLSCVPRSEMCPRCPTSDTVRCGSDKPVLDTVSGACHPLDAIDMMNIACDPVADAGFTVDVTKHTVVPLFNSEHKKAGLIEVHPDMVHPDGPQPCGESLTCIDVSTCDHRATSAALNGQLRSHAVNVNSGSELMKGVYLALPAFDLGIGSIAADTYGHCLGRYSHESGRWECVDEALTLRHNMMAGGVSGSGCYALMVDNCPDHHNPMQLDRDMNGEGDLCQGGATLCEDCHSWNNLNVKYLQKGAPEDTERVKDDCAENQSPVVITTEPNTNARYDAREEL